MAKKASRKPAPIVRRARIAEGRARNESSEVLATAKWLLRHTVAQRNHLRSRLARKDRTIPFRDAHILGQALALIIEPKSPPRGPQPVPYGTQGVLSVVRGGAPGLGKR